jgi:hypothetical protein
LGTTFFVELPIYEENGDSVVNVEA